MKVRYRTYENITLAALVLLVAVITILPARQRKLQNQTCNKVEIDPSRHILYITSVHNYDRIAIDGALNEFRSRGFKFGMTPDEVLRENQWAKGGFPQKPTKSRANIIVICVAKIQNDDESGREFVFIEPVYDRIVGTRLERISVQ